MKSLKILHFGRCLVCLFAVTACTANELPSDILSPDCGESAIYTFLRLNQVRTDLESVMKHVTRKSEKGLSFAELQVISRALGVETEGIHVSKLDEIPKEPMIVALRHDDEGHFIVLRPIEGSPTLVQVFDQTAEPKITHIDQLMSTAHWTGRLLVKKHSWLSMPQIGLLSSGIMMLAGYARWTIKSRSPVSD